MLVDGAYSFLSFVADLFIDVLPSLNVNGVEDLGFFFNSVAPLVSGSMAFIKYFVPPVMVNALIAVLILRYVGLPSWITFKAIIKNIREAKQTALF